MNAALKAWLLQSFGKALKDGGVSFLEEVVGTLGNAELESLSRIVTKVREQRIGNAKQA